MSNTGGIDMSRTPPSSTNGSGMIDNDIPISESGIPFPTLLLDGKVVIGELAASECGFPRSSMEITASANGSTMISTNAASIPATMLADNINIDDVPNSGITNQLPTKSTNGQVMIAGASVGPD
jgi:hypothetical protein